MYSRASVDTLILRRRYEGRGFDLNPCVALHQGGDLVVDPGPSVDVVGEELADRAQNVPNEARRQDRRLRLD